MYTGTVSMIFAKERHSLSEVVMQYSIIGLILRGIVAINNKDTVFIFCGWLSCLIFSNDSFLDWLMSQICY